MDLATINAVYFIGAGGIGMSALIRYFLSKNISVGGYDRTPSDLTSQLIQEGAEIHYEDNIDAIPNIYKDKAHTLIIYTPAVPSDHSELMYFQSQKFRIVKRAEALGTIVNDTRGICVAGTHGKTTTSSMVAHLMKQSTVDCNAFLGGIMKGSNSNLMLAKKGNYTVVEADEYDRSFHWLHPYIAIITSADPDHLDIYGTPEAYKESFEHYTSLIKPHGFLIIKKGVAIKPQLQQDVVSYSYSATEIADFYAENICIDNAEIYFDFVGPNFRIEKIKLGVPVRINIENSVAAIAAAWICGVSIDEIRKGMASYQGIQRRFDFHLKKPNIVFLDDYAHHPRELYASIQSIKELYPEKKITGVFQPHLYSRTRDFCDDFAKSLSILDELILLDIYPAREEPIPGVSSEMIFEKVTIKNKQLCKKEDLLRIISEGDYEVVIMLGAGDIDRLIKPVEEILNKRD